MSAFYTHYTTHCPIDGARIDALLALLAPARDALISGEYSEAKPLLEAARAQDDLAEIETLARSIREKYTHVVVVGAGGSALGGRTLCALNPSAKPAMHFLENIDPHGIDDLLARIETARTCFIVISKSGGTVETLGHFYTLLGHMQRMVGEQASAHFIVITTQTDNPLRRGASANNIRILNHAPAIGGRFSAFTNVGLLPAAIAGLDIRAVRRGSASVIAEMKNARSMQECQPALGAALQFAFMERGRNISVMLPYAERLGGFSSWYRQSWAESLGKGGNGTTAIRAVGTTDQHSQLQLYLDGPKDKLIHYVTLKRAGTGQRFDVPNDPELAYIKGKTTGDIMAAEQKATLETLARNGCPVRVFELNHLGEAELGALLMHFTLEIIFMSQLLGVDPFDQPAVEESKRLARDYLLTGNL